MDSKGSTLWKLLKSTMSIIQSKLTWTPGNGKLINVWTDNIMGKPPLGTHDEFPQSNNGFLSKVALSLQIYLNGQNKVFGKDGENFTSHKILKRQHTFCILI
jgi:hypothetical protein